MSDKLLKDEHCVRFLKELLCENKTLSGEEYDEIWMLLQLMEPESCSNNQITYSETFLMSGRRYVVTYFGDEKPMIDEYTLENNTDK